MGSKDEDVFFFQASTLEESPGIVEFDLTPITQTRDSLRFGNWFIQLEYIFFKQPNLARALAISLESPQVVDGNNINLPLAFIKKPGTVALADRTCVFSCNDIGRRILRPIYYKGDKLKVLLVVGLTAQGPHWRPGSIAPLGATIGISIHIPHGPAPNYLNGKCLF